MRKHGCGMISYNIIRKSTQHSLSNGERSGKGALKGETYPFISGGQTPLSRQSHAHYFSDPNYPNLSYTNEVHCMYISTSPGIT